MTATGKATRVVSPTLAPMETVLLHVTIAGLQLSAIGFWHREFYQVLRLIMPILAALAIAGLIQQDAPFVWIAPFLATGMLFFAVPELPRLLWLPINLTVAAVSLAYLGQLAWQNFIG